MATKTRVAIIFGGKSEEHEVSVRSARNVIEAIDKSKYEVVLIGIDKKGSWHLNDASRFLLDCACADPVSSTSSAKDVTLVSRHNHGELIGTAQEASFGTIDVVFPILHGPNGEDGTMQGLLKLAGIPFVGPGVLGSAVSMDKDVTKRLLRDAGIPIGRFETFDRSEQNSIDLKGVIQRLKLPLFVKPANLGSSVGISKAKDEASLKKALDFAFTFDRKALVEEFIEGREIEVAVLGNEHPEASLPGEIITGSQHEFYSYDAKYIDNDGQRIEIPANLPQAVVENLRAMAVKTFKVLCCEGMSRVDFFVKKDGSILVNEINTIPGFTNISMYPKLWEASGIPYAQLIDKLIQFAIQRGA
ncbi:MAG: D-alanine--D-alanine ligase [Deltaproteobacteria bacterium]|nr:D-alanine--D-alanine ligase [Deltaproteobacteria bacterium]